MSPDSTSPASNSELAERLRDGDRQAADALVQRLEPWLRKVVDRKIGPRLRRRIDAEDITQSAFWSFCRRTSDGQYEFEHSGALCRLLLTIADNKIRRASSYHTRQCRNVEREETLDVDSLDLSEGNWESAANVIVDEVASVVDRLSPRDAEFFRLRYMLGHSAGRISTETGWSLATVKRVLKRTVEEIRRRIREED